MTRPDADPIRLPIAPGGWLGMVGGGQLGRMFCHAAQSLGYKVAVLDPGHQCPAGVVADWHIEAAYDDDRGLEQLSARCPAITTEFENVPASSLRKLAERSRVSPAADSVAIAQDRIREKAFIQALGVPVVPHAVIRALEDIAAAPDTLFPGVLKAASMGYDGKGQVRITTRAEAREAFVTLGGVACVLEAFMKLEAEISVVLARGFDGGTVVYPPAINEHRKGILAISTIPAEDFAMGQKARAAALTIAHGLEYVGVLCVEFFVLGDGSLVANEMAPRPHNSGHYSINACVTSQFEQQARVMAGLPLGSTRSLCPSIMLNILGDAWFDPGSGRMREPDWAGVLGIEAAKLHLYGKSEARRGRKMGHVTLLGETLDEARRSAAQVAQALGIAY